ncbi:MAG TPA: hypothetical protein VNO70_05355 [Blastocatellia bacterium]|nr:hypothetical protein [Blastocatellia bacterium]
MDPETIYVMNDGMYGTVLMLIQGITLGISLACVLFILFCLACAALDSFAQLRWTARRQPVRAPEPPEPDEYDLLAPGLYIAKEIANNCFRISGGTAGMNDGRAGSLTGGVARRKSALILPSARKPEGF